MYPISGNTKAHTFWGVFLSLLSYHSNRRHGAVFARNVPSFLNFYAVDQQGPAVPHPLFPTRVGIAQCHGAVSDDLWLHFWADSPEGFNWNQEPQTVPVSWVRLSTNQFWVGAFRLMCSAKHTTGLFPLPFSLLHSLVHVDSGSYVMLKITNLSLLPHTHLILFPSLSISFCFSVSHTHVHRTHTHVHGHGNIF